MNYPKLGKILDDIMIHMEENVMEQFPRKKLENKIRDLITELTNTIYISNINIKYNHGIYTLQLGLNCKEAVPMSISYQGNEEEFIEFVKKEFIKRKPHEIRYTKGTLLNGDGEIHYPIIEL